MLFLWSLFMWVISNGYSTPTNEVKRYSARTMQYFEPQTIENRKIDDECPLFCQDWRTPFYVKEVEGCDMFDSTNNINDTYALGDYMFCPDKGTIKCWTKENELEFKALLEYLKILDDSEYEVLKEMKGERKLSLSIYLWNNPGPVESMGGDNSRRFQENGKIRRRARGSVSSFKCFGGRGGRSIKSINKRSQPVSVSVRHGRLIDSLEFTYYAGWIVYAKLKVSGGGRGGRSSRFKFNKFTSSCVDRVHVRSGRLVDGIRFGGGSRSSPWYGGNGGRYHTLTAPSGRCLGDVQMRAGRLVDQICFKFNAYKCTGTNCGPGRTRKCHQFGKDKPKCSGCNKCSSRDYAYRACTSTSRTICKRCRSCNFSKEYQSRACSNQYDRRCSTCWICRPPSYKIRSCTSTANTVCKVCSRCSQNQYISRACGGTQNTVCNSCRHCAANHYESRSCQWGQNRVCSPCTTCRPCERETRACTKKHNRVCSFSNAYFSQRHIDEIFIIMTHNSLAVKNKVWSPNQNHGLVTQFRDGIRGFNFDLYMDGNKLMTKHDTDVKWKKQYDPSEEIRDLVRELGKSTNIGEFIIIQLENYLNLMGMRMLSNLFGSKLVKNFDTEQTFGHYLKECQQVLIFADGISDKSIGIHQTDHYISENDYEWEWRYQSPPLGHRRGPTPSSTNKRFMRLMSYFCSAIQSGDMVASHEVHNTGRALRHIRNYERQSYAGGKINVLLVDYYRSGFTKKGVYEIFIVQYVMRHGGSSGLNAGALCPYTNNAMCQGSLDCGKRSKSDPTYICCHVNHFSFWGLITFSDFC